MDQKPCLNIEEIEYNGRSFYRSTFMDISVVRSDTMFYNATKICQDNGYDNFGRISRLENWKRHFNAMLTRCKINPISKKITRNQNLASGETSEEIGLIPLTEDDLMFEIKNQQGVHAWINGVYIHKWLFNHLLSMIDDDYALTIDEIVDLMDEELQLRNITLEQKISEQEKLIQDLKDLHERSGRGKNHDLPGCIFYRPWNDAPNTYKIWFCEVEKHYTDKNIKTINDIYNPKDTCATLNIATKNGQFEDMKWIGNCVLEFENDDVLIQHVKEVQAFEINIPTIETMITNCKISYQVKTVDFKARMFEIFCSQKYGVPVYKYTPCERLGLTKRDKGVDLLDVDNKIIGQCKYYIKSTLEITSLYSFLNFCTEYNDYEHKLYVSSRTKMSDAVLSLEETGEIEITIVDEDEFNQWYDENTSEMDEFRVDGYNINYDIVEYKNAQEYVKKQLVDHPFVYIDELVLYIDNNYNIKCSSSVSFGRLFGHLYRKTKHTSLPEDIGNGRKFIVSADKLQPIVKDGQIIKDGSKTHSVGAVDTSNFDKERAFLIRTIDCKQIECDELIDLFKQEFHKEINVATILASHSDLFIMREGICHEQKYRQLIIKQVNKQSYRVFELKNEYKPNAYERFNEFASRIDFVNDDTARLFNEEFGRYDSPRAINDLFSEFNIKPHSKSLIEERNKLINLMGCMQLTKLEMFQFYKSNFGKELNSNDLLWKHEEIFKCKRAGRGIRNYTRTINGKEEEVFELKMKFMPKDTLDNIITTIEHSVLTLDKTSDLINKNFHRHDSNRSINGFIKEYRQLFNVIR